jgi:hypothetical protein
VSGGVAALEQRATGLADLQRLARLESVIIGDDDLGAIDIRQHVHRDQFAAAVVAVRVVGLKDTQPVLDGDSRGDNQESAAVEAAAGVRAALMVCHAISIAMTVVLPLPVAIFKAMRKSSGFDCSLAPCKCLRNLS